MKDGQSKNWHDLTLLKTDRAVYTKSVNFLSLDVRDESNYISKNRKKRKLVE